MILDLWELSQLDLNDLDGNYLFKTISIHGHLSLVQGYLIRFKSKCENFKGLKFRSKGCTILSLNVSVK